MGSGDLKIDTFVENLNHYTFSIHVCEKLSIFNQNTDFNDETKNDYYVRPFTACWITRFMFSAFWSLFVRFTGAVRTTRGRITEVLLYILIILVLSTVLLIVLINFYPKWEALYPTRSSSSPAGLFICKITFLDQEKGSNTPSVLAAEFDLAFGLWPWPTDHVMFGLRQPCSSLSTIKICAWLFFVSSIVCFLLTLKIV